MSDTIINTKNKRSILAAIAFSLLMPGLGQVYCGKLSKGLVLNFFNILPLPLIIFLFAISNSSLVVPITITLLVAGGIVQLYAIIDSAVLAKRYSKVYELKDYNRWYVYVLFVLIVTGGSLGSALYLKGQVVQAFIIPATAPSCYPTILPKEKVLANKMVYKKNEPQIGDTIVFKNPENRNEYRIKRIVALAGDTVEIKDGYLYINDVKLQRNELDQSELDNIRIKFRGKPLEGRVYEEINGDAKYKVFFAKEPDERCSADFPKTTVPPYHCFVLGDNRYLSYDSRLFGPIQLATIVGRADYIFVPRKNLARFGKIDQ
jgi:signal peptidase I